GATQGNSNGFGSEFVVGGEILSDGCGAVTGVGHGDVSGLRLGQDELFQIIPLPGNDGIQRVIDQNGEAESVFAAPVGDLQTLLAVHELDVVFFEFRRSAV